MGLKYVLIVILLQINFAQAEIINHGKNLFKKGEYSDTVLINNLFDKYYSLRESEPKQALLYLQKGIEIADSINNKSKTALLLYHKGHLYRKLGIYSLALKSDLKALNIYKELGEKNLIGWLLIDIGDLYLDRDDELHIALDHYVKALNNFSSLKNATGIAVANYCIGQIYVKKREFIKAINNYETAARVSIGLKDKRHEILSYSLMGRASLAMDDVKKAGNAFQKSLTISRQSNTLEGIASNFENYGDLNHQLGNKQVTIFKYLDALSVFNKIPDQVAISKILIKISKVYSEIGDVKNAKSYVLKALDVANTNAILQEQQEALFLLSGYYSKQNQPLKALETTNRYLLLKESANDSKYHQLEEEYEYQLHKQETSLLRSEGEMKSEKINYQRKLLYLSISGAVLLLIMMLLLFRKHKQLRSSYHYLYKSHSELIRKEQSFQEQKKMKYSGSLLRNEQNQNLLNDLMDLMSNEKIFLDKAITLNDLAKRLNTNRTYLSQIINDRFHNNFNNFINEYRVKEAQRLLLGPRGKILTIEGIAQDVGFNSRSSFNGAFKKVTGLTPSEFITLREKEESSLNASDA